MHMEYIWMESPLGRLLLAAQKEKLAGVWMEGQRYFPPDLTAVGTEGETPVLRWARTWLERYFAGERPDAAELPLEMAGSDFQKQVWAALREIPYGETVTYGALAEQLRLGRNAARAVGSAVGRNPISIVIPCHRVVGAGGRLTGYAGGLERKRWLLEHESGEPKRADL